MARSFDFLVVGGGMGGVSAGFELSRHGTVAALARLCRALALGEGVPADLAAFGLDAATLLPRRLG